MIDGKDINDIDIIKHIHSNKIDIIKFLNSGMAMIGGVYLYRGSITDPDPESFETMLIINEEQKYINKLGYRPIIEVKLAVYEVNGIYAVSFLIMVNQDPDMLYESWLNYFWEDGKKYFEDLSKQDNIIISYFCADEITGEIKRNLRIKYKFRNGGQNMEKANKVERHQRICESLNKLYELKNRKYGDSFSKTYKEYGPSMLCIRLDDKLGRLKQLLLKGEEGTEDETAIDTLIDLANYAIMGVMELEDKYNE
ncbi:nucleotide modification associated domain-containing protein [Anaerosolibacter sp.]|uniref:nucleotide modification associated domain-containing protein n=1 Tax=Anaerosolibacter sp. TaxID=1872527 RepID=UPI0039F04F1B